MDKVNSSLVKFIREARKRGFDDVHIRSPLLKKGWPLEEIEAAFASITKNKKEYCFKNKVTLFLDNKILRIIEKRANKNLLTINEQIEDILRRSCLNAKTTNNKAENLDDLLISIFSRKKK